MIHRIADATITIVNVLMAFAICDILFTSHDFIYENRHVIIPGLIGLGCLAGIVQLCGVWKLTK